MTRIIFTIAIFAIGVVVFGATPRLAAASGFDDGVSAIRSGDYQTARQAFRRLADQGDARAQYQLGQLHAQGHGAPRDYALAAQWYRKAAEQGYAEAQFDLGALYRRGAGVPQSNAVAVKWWHEAADSGDAVAQSALGEMYLDGAGVTPDLVQAYKWLMLAEPRDHSGRVPWGAIGLNDLTKRLTAKQRSLAQREVRRWIAAHKP